MALRPITSLTNEELETRCVLKPWERALQSNMVLGGAMGAAIGLAIGVFMQFRERWFVGAVALAAGVLFLSGTAAFFVQARLSEWRRRPFVEELKRRAGQANLATYLLETRTSLESPDPPDWILLCQAKAPPTGRVRFIKVELRSIEPPGSAGLRTGSTEGDSGLEEGRPSPQASSLEPVASLELRDAPFLWMVMDGRGKLAESLSIKRADVEGEDVQELYELAVKAVDKGDLDAPPTRTGYLAQVIVLRRQPLALKRGACNLMAIPMEHVHHPAVRLMERMHRLAEKQFGKRLISGSIE